MFFLGFSEALPAILLLSPGVSFVNTYVVQRVLQRNDQAAWCFSGVLPLESCWVQLWLCARPWLAEMPNQIAKPLVMLLMLLWWTGMIWHIAQRTLKKDLNHCEAESKDFSHGSFSTASLVGGEELAAPDAMIQELFRRHSTLHERHNSTIRQSSYKRGMLRLYYVPCMSHTLLLGKKSLCSGRAWQSLQDFAEW